MTKTHISHVFSCACLVALLCCSCKKQPEATTALRPLPVDIQVIDSVAASVMHTYVGEVQSASSTPLSFPFGGRITRINIADNTPVKQGQILLQTDSTQAFSVLQSAQASLLQAQDAYNRLKQVYEQGGVPEIKWVEIQTQLEKARSMVAGAEKSLDDCTLRAPHDGILTGLDLQTGQQLAPGQRVATLLDVTSVNIVFHVPETEIAQTVLGDRLYITVPALNNASYTGSITERNLTGNKLSHTYMVKSSLPNPHANLMPGMVCKVQVPRKQNSGYVLPAHCIQIRPEGQSVWIVSEGKAYRRPILTGQFVKDGVLVLSGLAAGDTVITDGYQKLYTAAPITIRQ